MRFLIWIHIAVSLVAVLLAWIFVGQVNALSVAAGTGASLINLLGLSIAWPRILAKKQVALAISVIVFKFAILVWILFEVVRRQTLSIGWFAFGMGLVIVSVVWTALKTADDPA